MKKFLMAIVLCLVCTVSFTSCDSYIYDYCNPRTSVSYNGVSITTMVGSLFNAGTYHTMGVMGKAFREADFQIMTNREIAPTRITSSQANIYKDWSVMGFFDSLFGEEPKEKKKRVKRHAFFLF